MCAYDEFWIPRMNYQIVNGCRGQIGTKRVPGGTAIDTRVHAKVGTHVENPRIGRIFSDDVYRFGWQIRRDRHPGFAEVGRAVYVLFEIVVAISGEGYIHGTKIVP